MFCISCGNKVPDAARFCAKCGKPVEADADRTVLGEAAILDANQETFAPDVPLQPPPTPRLTPAPSRPRSTPPSNPALTTPDPIGGGRFAPGTIIAERYRIVALLG